MAFACTIPAIPTVQQDDATLRITRWDFAPGAVTGWHEHGWPYFVVMLVAGTLRVHDGENVGETALAAGQAYSRPAGIRHATGFYVLTLAGGQICAMTRFEASVLPWFGLPRSLPSR